MVRIAGCFELENGRDGIFEANQ